MEIRCADLNCGGTLCRSVVWQWIPANRHCRSTPNYNFVELSIEDMSTLAETEAGV